ncbi:MFS transporter [Candidatus Aerophobetes bacterium]|nr:MFS transporter [Candidatus Aerophobetes bacterium]
MKIKTSDRKGNKLKWNFAMGLLHGIFFNGGMGFSDPNTVLPAFINSLTNSKVLIGLFASTVETKGSFSRLGSVLPQLFVANKLETKIHKKPLLITAIVVRALCWGILAGLIFCFNGSQTFFLLLSSFLLLALFTFMGGVASIPFMDIWGKALPSNLRGRFFGYRQLLGGILAIGAGFVVQQILSNKEIPFPKNFSFLFFLSFIFISFSYIALGLVKEPVEEVHRRVVKFRHFLREAIATLRDDRNYQRFLLVQFLRGTGSLALPFYVIYAKDILKINLGMVGIFISAQMVGGLLSNLLWAYVSDYIGNRRVIQMSLAISFLTPVVALLINPGFSSLFILVFVLIGFFINGGRIGYTNYLLDISPSKKRPTYISLSNTFLAPTAIFPLAGGIIIQYISFATLFILTALAVFAGFFLSFKLEEPRKR